MSLAVQILGIDRLTAALLLQVAVVISIATESKEMGISSDIAKAKGNFLHIAT